MPRTTYPVLEQEKRPAPVEGGQPVFGGQLQDDGGDERLGDAARAEVIGAADAGARGRVADAVPVAFQEGRGGCSAFGEEL
ncbi:hypothetical protein ACWC6I_06495 [Streptomyces sp. NPDC001414]